MKSFSLFLFIVTLIVNFSTRAQTKSQDLLGNYSVTEFEFYPFCGMSFPEDYDSTSIEKVFNDFFILQHLQIKIQDKDRFSFIANDSAVITGNWKIDNDSLLFKADQDNRFEKFLIRDRIGKEKLILETASFLPSGVIVLEKAEN